MLRFCGNTVSAIPSPIPLVVVKSQDSDTYVLLNTSNVVYTNSALLTLVQSDITSGVSLGSSKRYLVDGTTYDVDFTRLVQN